MPIQMRKAWTEGMFILYHKLIHRSISTSSNSAAIHHGFTPRTSSAAPDLVNISPARSHNIKYLHFIGFINPLHNSFSRFSGRAQSRAK
jgi:hypothetical protein